MTNPVYKGNQSLGYHKVIYEVKGDVRSVQVTIVVAPPIAMMGPPEHSNSWDVQFDARLP